MNRIGIFLILASTITAFGGCADTTGTSTTRQQSVSPKALVYMSADTVKMLSITHNCTCPFNWNCVPYDSSLVVTSGTGDNTSVPVKVDRSRIAVDTLNTYLLVRSAFGIDTVHVTVYR